MFVKGYRRRVSRSDWESNVAAVRIIGLALNVLSIANIRTRVPLSIHPGKQLQISAVNN